MPNFQRKTVKSSRVLISLPDKFLEEIDLLATEEQRTRSELIREALRIYLRAIEDITADDVNQLLV
jgi:metal-responsive CopG/Arc/MetJ family transcriptional regulator